MDHYKILDQNPGTLADDPANLEWARCCAAALNASAMRQAESARGTKPLPPKRMGFGAEENEGDKKEVEEDEPTLAQMAAADLDAALQLLADRAQYITGASGAAIALRRGERHDMLCRASSGSNAPELGALLSMNHGLSGECVRTRQALCCDDANEDPRVNREVCVELGIASVVVMPIISDDSVLGVFELFSGKPDAFGERDLSTLTRLSRMVETALRHADAAPAGLNVEAMTVAASKAEEMSPADQATQAAFVNKSEAALIDGKDEITKKALLWSAGPRAQAAEKPAELPPAAASAAKKLPSCQACGFPVTPGRNLCVECEEKKWSGQKLGEPAATEVSPQPALPKTPWPEPARGTFFREAAGSGAVAPDSTAASSNDPAPFDIPSSNVKDTFSADPATAAETPLATDAGEPALALPFPPYAAETDMEEAAPFLSSALPSRSWFQENKFVVFALLLVGIAAAVFNWLH
jgi:hypothetical protein